MSDFICCWSETIDDLVKRDGLFYKKFTEVPFTGKITGQFLGSFKNGKEEGYWVGYYDNGQLNFKGDFKNGKKDDSIVHYLDDKTLLTTHTGTFKNGVKIND